jgi:glycosyltransferase involved in cell wall biosynthesis
MSQQKILNLTKTVISVIVPAYNEELVIEQCYQHVLDVFAVLDGYELELVFINDGSSDDTQKIVDRICKRDPCVASVELSRNFGKEIAMTAGIDHATGDAIVIIDADLQDPPELIPQMIAGWHEGYDVVYGRRTDRVGETWLKKVTAAGFYQLIKKMSRVEIPRDTGDFRLMSRRAVNALLQLREQHRFIKGLFAWVGFPSKAIEYRRAPRAAGNTKFNYWKLWNFALEGITSFTIAPLKIATYIGLSAAFAAFVFGFWIAFKTLAFGEPVKGYPTLMITILFFGGVQLFFIGLLGEYLGRVFNETKQRPLYFVQSYRPANFPYSSSLDDTPSS